MTTAEKLYHRAVSEGGAVIRNGHQTAVINHGFKIVHRPDQKREYRVYNCNELPDDYVEISQSWLLELLEQTPKWSDLSHRIREANKAKNYDNYCKEVQKIYNDYLPKSK